MRDNRPAADRHELDVAARRRDERLSRFGCHSRDDQQIGRRANRHAPELRLPNRRRRIDRHHRQEMRGRHARRLVCDAELFEQIAGAGQTRIGADGDVRLRPRRIDRPSEQKHVRRGTPDGAGASRGDAPPSPGVDPHAVDEHGIRRKAAERFEAFELAARGGVDAFGDVHEERRRCRRRSKSALDVAASLAARPGRPILQQERVRPSVLAQHAQRHVAAQLRIERIVVRDRRHSAQHVLQRAHEQSIAQRMAAGLSDRRVVGEPRTHVTDPFARIAVPVAKLDSPVMIQLEVVVRVDEPRQHERSADIDDGVARARRIANREHPRREPHRLRRPLPGDDARVGQRDRGRPDHGSFIAWKITTIGGLPHRFLNARIDGSSPAFSRGSRIASTRRPAPPRALRC